MLELMLNRYDSDDNGTFGTLAGEGMLLTTLELPWRDNKPNMSCIPKGDYICELVQSPHFGQVYQIQNVPGRSHILIHPGNLAGDVALGLRSDSEGCILPGLFRTTVAGQSGIAHSRSALAWLMNNLGGQPFKLIIFGAYAG